MATEVVSVTSRIPDRAREPYYRYSLWHDSLTTFGIQPTVLGMGEPWQGLMTKPRRLREWLRSGACTSDLLIVCDSYDVVFLSHTDEIADRYHSFNWTDDSKTPVLFNAEKGIFPRGDLAHHFRDTGTDWKFLNSGFYIGPPAVILQMLEGMLLDDLHDDYQHADGRWTHVNDQGWYQVGYALHVVPQALDAWGRIVQCCSACSLEEFDLTGPRVKNLATGTEPLVWHFNGNSKDLLLPQMLPKWGMEHYL